MPPTLPHPLAHPLQALQSTSPPLQVLTDPSTSTFQHHATRWTDIGRLTPSAIILPRSEVEIQKAVQWAHEFCVPFVAKSGGHSEWSTIGEGGVVIDLSCFSGVEVEVGEGGDEEGGGGGGGGSARVWGSVTTKEVAVELARKDLFTALGNGNPIGAIPYFLNGGASTTTPLTGFGSDQILRARLIDATGRLISVTPESQPELLWALRGAGQFFGLVTELVVKAHPLSLLGNPQGLVWMGRFVFPVERAEEVARVMKTVVEDEGRATAGLVMVMAAPPPPGDEVVLVVAARYYGGDKGGLEEEAREAYRALYELEPLSSGGAGVPIQNLGDGHEAYNAHGTYKRFGVVGLREFDVGRFLETVEVYKELVAECPDAGKTSFNFQWDSRWPKTPEFESAMSLHDVRYWQNNFIWHTSPSSRQKVDEYNDRCIAIVRGPDRSQWADFQNGTREGPIELRFRGEGKVEKLRELKKIWDPRGVFSRQLLE